MKKINLKELEHWYEVDDHQKIIEAILKIPKEEWDFVLIGHLGRAYNNDAQYDKAIEVLLSVSDQGRLDRLWNFRLGFAYFYKDEDKKALPYFEKSLELGDTQAQDFIEWCKTNIAQEKRPKPVVIAQEEHTIVLKSEQSISVCFYIEQPIPFEIGEQLHKIRKNIYMNGYNWEAFFSYYLQKNHPDLCFNMQTDPEAGLYVAYYHLSTENQQKAIKLMEVIEYLIGNKEVLFEFVREEGDNIPWLLR